MTSVVQAVADGKPAGAQQAFSAEGARQLTDRFRFARAHDGLSKLGTFQGLLPYPGATPSSAGAYRREIFLATFTSGTRRVDVTFDDRGKIVAFWLH